MDPFTAILLIGVMTIAGVKTAGDKVNDGIAQARGNTPASLEKWRANEEKRRKRGEQPRTDPGGIRRIWQNQTEYAAEKSAKKHQGRLDYLDRNGDEIATGKRERMERADRRRQAVGGVLARAGGSSWEALKTAAQKAADARRTHAEHATERQAWRENERRDADTAGWVDDDGRGHPRRYSSESGSGWQLPVVYGEDGNPYCVHPDGSWSPYESVPMEAEDAVAEATVLPFDRQSTSKQHERQPDQRSAGAAPVQPESSPDPEHDVVRDPDRPGHTVSVAELQRRRHEQSQERQRQHEAGQAQAEREHIERMAGARPDSTAETESEQEQNQEDPNTATGQDHAERRTASTTADTSEGDAMSTPQSSNVEITDLETAQLRADESAQYAATVQSVLDTQMSGIRKAIAGMEAEAGQQEQGSTSLNGEGFDTGITGRFDSGAEKYHNAVAALRQLDKAVNTAKDEVNLAQNEMTSASSFFSQQQAISESLSAAGQGGGISSRTGFYTGA